MVHLAAARGCRPLAFILTAGQAPDPGRQRVGADQTVTLSRRTNQFPLGQGNSANRRPR